jgi:Ca2+-transporting ATPase
VELALKAGIDVPALRTEHPTSRTRYRAEERPYMSTLHPYRGTTHLLAVKGSPEQVLERCTYQMRGGRRVRLTGEARAAIIAENSRMASDALRVLGVAYREVQGDRMPRTTGSLTWLGLAGMADPMRPGMEKLIAQYHRAGIETIMITGDQSGTAYAIGKQLGLSGNRPLQVLESSKLEDMDPELLAGLVKNVHVFARVSPAHKLKIVQALQQAGYVVAMTGDGINDGPALKAADVGVAMGGTGTNVARDVSDVVLEDDNLHTMAVAVRQGRTIYNNIRKMIHFMVSTNLTEIEVMLAGIALGLGQPMNPMQLLWINLVTDIFPGLALSLEPPEPDIMERDPRDPNEKIIAGRDLGRMTFESGIIGLGTLGAYIYGLRRYGDPAVASTMAFNTLTLNELAHALSSRSKYRNVFGGQSLPPNPHLTRAILGMGGLQAVVSLVPALRRLLGTTPLGLVDLLVIGAGVLAPLIINEATKPSLPKEPEEEVESEIIDSETNNAEKEEAA